MSCPLVEVDETWGSPAQLGDLAGRCGYSWLFTPAFEFGNGKPEGDFGNALLTNLPILAAHQWQLLWPPQLSHLTEPSEPRALLLARLGSPGGPFWAGSSHLPREDEQARTTALARLQVLTGGLLEPWLIAGDFNTPASSWLDPAAPFAVSAPLMTYPAEPIDYCIASPGFQLDTEVLDSVASDHLPLLISAHQTG
jgi:endonuclease/exonuclease/phosphatase family metal-dependent hydrolase